MLTFLAIQNTYESVEIALFQDTHQQDLITEHKFTASKNLIPCVDTLLKRNNCSLGEITFIGANQGPGPFTSLRTVIASINGISFACGTPLVGVNGLEALLQEHPDITADNQVVMLNAFGKDVYYLTSIDGTKTQGSKNVFLLLQEIKNAVGDQPVRFLGNGTHMYHDEITDLFGEQAIIPEQLPHICSVKQIGLMALKLWQRKESITQHMLPIYLKTQIFKKQI